jgi:hypothetical protein
MSLARNIREADRALKCPALAHEGNVCLADWFAECLARTIKASTLADQSLISGPSGIDVMVYFVANFGAAMDTRCRATACLVPAGTILDRE